MKRATGADNNCLIDTLRQCLVPPDGIPLYDGYLERVRYDLATYDFPGGPARVFDAGSEAGANFLDLQKMLL